MHLNMTLISLFPVLNFKVEKKKPLLLKSYRLNLCLMLSPLPMKCQIEQTKGFIFKFIFVIL